MPRCPLPLVCSGRAVSSTIEPLMEFPGIDVILEVTGAVDFGARVAIEAFKHKKHVIAMNAELDGTIGPILKVCACGAHRRCCAP